MDYTLVKEIRENELLRNSFMDLSAEIFNLPFQPWYQNGFWTDRYLPYAAVQGNKVVANASVNRIDTMWRGEKKSYIQIGTVMTHPAYRGQGLSRMLLEEILADWKGKSNAVYLYANDTVLDFYPRFGFVEAQEYRYCIPVAPRRGDFVKLNMDKREHGDLLKSCYLKSNPFAELPLLNNYELLMFYCTGLMKECVYYSRQYHTACVAQRNGDTLTCLDVFGEPLAALDTLLAGLTVTEAQKVWLGFTPKHTGNCCCQLIENGETLFVLSEKENVFQNNRVMMPVLSHA